MTEFTMQTVRLLARRGFLLFMLAAIFYLSHQPSVEIIPPLFPMQDKVLHAIEFFLLFASLLLNKDLCRGFHPLPTLLAAGSLWALSDEIHQSYVPGRDCSAGDFLADVVGMVICLLIYLFFCDREYSA